MKTALRSVFGVLLLWGLTIGSAIGQVSNSNVYYVSTNGSDSNDGHLVADGGTGPWRTIQHAAQVLVAGDTVYVKAGTYNEQGPVGNSTKRWGILPKNDGVAGAPITYAAYPGDTVTLDTNGQSPCITIYGRQYITIRGFHITDCYQSGVWIMSGSGRLNGHINVSDNVISNIDGASGSNVAGIRADYFDYATFSNNIIYHIRVAGALNDNGSGIHSYGMSHVLVENNEIYDAYNGVRSKEPNNLGTDEGDYRKNIIHDVLRAFDFNTNTANPATAIHKNPKIYQNVVYNSKAFVYDTTQQSLSQNIGLQIYNNVIDGGSVTFQGFAGIQFYNNVVLNTTVQTEYQSNVFTSPDTRKAPFISYIDYNDYFPAPNFRIGVYSGIEKDFTSLSSWSKALPAPGSTLSLQDTPLASLRLGTNTSGGPIQPGVRSVAVDPLFVNASQHDYHLAQGSPLIGAGKNGQNIGAYLSASDVIGPTQVPAPSAPTLNVK